MDYNGYDKLPESLLESEQPSTMYEAIDNLESAVSSIREAVEFLEKAKDWEYFWIVYFWWAYHKEGWKYSINLVVRNDWDGHRCGGIML